MAFSTNDSSGNLIVQVKESFSDFIKIIDHKKCPISTRLTEFQMMQPTHYALNDSYATPNADNQKVQGADANAASDTTRTSTVAYTQIFEKVVEVSGTLEASAQYGIKSEVSYQTAKKMIEIKRDLEARVISTNTPVAPVGQTTAGESGGLGYYITTYVDSTYANSLRIGSSSSGKTEFTDVLQSAADAGAEIRDVFVGGTQKRAISDAWVTNVSRYTVNNQVRTLTDVVDVYVSDFGPLNIHYHWLMPVNACYLLDLKCWKLGYLKNRKFHLSDLAKTGDAVRKQILGEYALVSLGEDGNGYMSALTATDPS